jgi:hypothetical protein
MNRPPNVFRVRQHFDRPRIEDVPAEVERQLAGLGLARTVLPGQSVAITVGSRGITQLASIVKAIVDHLRGLDARPFIVPAMGSHAGGTAQGQKQVIESYGVTESAVGCPIRSSMETVVVCDAAEGFPVHFDRLASEADHVLVFNRIKLHTNFAGPLQSGLMKMMLIGLGKHAGADIYHRAIEDYDFDRIVGSVAREVIARCHILAGLAVVENAYKETALIAGLQPREIPEKEPQLLEQAARWMPRLPFSAVDVLVIDEIGKEISGTGLDTNVVGRKYHEHHAAEDETPKVKRIVVRSLTEKTGGNAAGIGFAEFCRSRVVKEMNTALTWTNCMTANHLSCGMIPVHYDTDRELLNAAWSTVGLAEPAESKLLWIKNTLQLTEVCCSEAYLAEARQREDLEILDEPSRMAFDVEGNLLPPPQQP